MPESDYPSSISEDILEILESRREQWLELDRVKNELLEANDTPPDEVERSNEVATRVFENLGIAVELDEIQRARRARIREVIDRNFPEVDQPDQRQGG